MVCLSVCLHVCPSACLFAYLCPCLPFHLSIMPVCLCTSANITTNKPTDNCFPRNVNSVPLHRSLLTLLQDTSTMATTSGLKGHITAMTIDISTTGKQNKSCDTGTKFRDTRTKPHRLEQTT